MFPVLQSSTANATPEDVIGRLKTHAEVEGIMLIGSTGTGRLEPSSDYDLFIVLSACPGWATKSRFATSKHKTPLFSASCGGPSQKQTAPVGSRCMKSYASCRQP